MFNKIKKELKGSKYTTIAIIIFALVLVFGIVLYRFLFPNTGSAIYGNRLDGIEKVQISKTDQKNMATKLEENAMVDKATMTIKGTILKYTLTIKSGVKKAEAKSITDNILKLLSTSEIEFYDIQVIFLNTNKDEAGYPMIANKNKVNKTFSYSGAK